MEIPKDHIQAIFKFCIVNTLFAKNKTREDFIMVRCEQQFTFAPKICRVHIRLFNPMLSSPKLNPLHPHRLYPFSELAKSSFQIKSN